MTKSYLKSVSSMQTKYPKKLLLWNYWDHEHIVGTHFAHYKKVKILFENDTVCNSERWAKLPYLPFYIKSNDTCVLVNENQMDVSHSTLFNLIKCKQTFVFDEDTNNNCKVTRYDYLEVPKILKFLQPLFDRLMKKWFLDVWKEDMPMRERRLKVWKLGFQDFKGIDYINDPNVKKVSNINRPYELKLPITKITQIKEEENGNKKTFLRKFKKSKHLGYGLPNL